MQAAAKNANIIAVNACGQSVWYDNLSRDVLKSGELAGLIAAGVSGLTSNPSIFKNAIADTAHYDEEIRRLAGQGLGTEALCQELMIQDVGNAADLLRPVYEESGGADGYASIEVSPLLARDTAGTVSAARLIWGKLGRPNIMIKVPGTAEGLPAVTALLQEGINVNVTLIFSVEVYESVVEAYLKALEGRVRNSQDPARVSSVASFFVSRVDSICEKTFDQLLKDGRVKEQQKTAFFGLAGVANSKLAYASYERIFSSGRFKTLRDKGARVQRPLWASTGTKNPAFSALLYLEELVGRDTVNTLPPPTLKTLLSKASIEPRLHSGLDHAKKVMDDLRAMGVPFDALLVELQAQGVKLFADAYNELLNSVEGKVKKLRG